MPHGHQLITMAIGTIGPGYWGILGLQLMMEGLKLQRFQTAGLQNLFTIYAYQQERYTESL